MIAWWWVAVAAAGGAVVGTLATLGGVSLLSKRTIRSIKAKVQERAGARLQYRPSFEDRLKAQYEKRGLPWESH